MNWFLTWSLDSKTDVRKQPKAIPAMDWKKATIPTTANVDHGRLQWPT
jgi:hypothetical protein